MARYIDTSKVTIPEGFFEDLNVPKLLKWLNNQPTADVIPKSEVERLTVELDAMRGAANSYKIHYENAKIEVARDIFAEIKEERRQWESVYCSDYFGEGGSAYGYLEFEVDDTLARLERKHTGGCKQ